MSPDLESLRRKVEAGERLSAAELDALRGAAQGSAGPTLWLAVAHALINAEANREALPLLERLRKDFPKDLQVRLGRARALLGLERYGDAEAALGEALALSPGDPEALKVLAVLAMRRGENARAQAHVAQVLERDPFDTEARLLKEELETGALPAPPLAEEQVLRPEFNAALAAALRRAGVAFRLQGRDVLVKQAGGEVARVDVASLFAAYGGSRQALAAYVDGLAARLGGLGTGGPEAPEAWMARLRPVLRPAGFEAQAAGALCRPGPAGLEVFYVLEDAEYVRYLPAARLGAVGLTAEEVDRAAWRNLEAHPAVVRPAVLDRGEVRLAETFSGLWLLAEGDGYDGARLLTAEQRRRLRLHAGEVPLRVSLGRREYALVCRESDAAECEALAGLGPAPDGIAGLFRLTDEGLLAVPTPR
ncbi:tetratricopeptide repeat protein [Stigmatella erecta]|uniref:Tetratricopeptide repeat-containing protein n=1 Tax=Stigmatella erecta TaxID=83460 RepID=A0A1I0KNB6_9BACT|nr:tetratricopeptide repeat protein [Stigmatella erecta]SEU26708.1 Tetratricopeptide repeat-containing protein [Stigmatella erecta]